MQSPQRIIRKDTNGTDSHPIQRNVTARGVEEDQKDTQVIQNDLPATQSAQDFNSPVPISRETKDELHTLTNRDQDHNNKRQEASKKLETTESELASVRNDLRLALQRIADLQQAMEDGDFEEDSSER